jgi:hypothetical protein
MIKLGQNRQHLDNFPLVRLAQFLLAMINSSRRTIFSRGKPAGRMNLPPANDVVAAKQLAPRPTSKVCASRTGGGTRIAERSMILCDG